MRKMFTTQLAGLFKRILDKTDFEIEDSARLLAQALVGEGSIYIKGFKEMEGVVLEALEGEEKLDNAFAFQHIDDLTIADRVLVISRYSDDVEAVKLANALIEKGIPFVAISGDKKTGENSLVELADFHINTQVVKPMLPNMDGTRVGFPSLIAALYIYHSLKFTMDEILEDYL